MDLFEMFDSILGFFGVSRGSRSPSDEAESDRFSQFESRKNGAKEAPTEMLEKQRKRIQELQRRKNEIQQKRKKRSIGRCEGNRKRNS